MLNLLRQHQTLSRQELSELTGLSGAAITGVVGELIEEGWVVETRSGQPRGGRPPVLLEIAYESWHAAGVKVMEDRLEVILTNLSTEVLAERRVRLHQPSPEALVQSVGQAVRALLKETGRTPERLIGVGVGMAGVIEPRRGVCLYSPFFHWKEVPIKDLLEAELSRPVWVDNDVNAFAVAEMLFGRGQNAQNFLVVTVGRGIGAGFVIGGQVYRGHRGGAGEFGHTVSEVGGRPCECGKRGCLEAYASEPALLAQALKRFPELRTKRGAHRVEQLVDATQAGHQGLQALLAEAGTRLGVGLANLVNLFNPELVVIGGEGVRLGERFFGPMKEALEQNAFNGLVDGLSVYVDPWGDDAWARGAAGLAIQKEVFADPMESSSGSQQTGAMAREGGR